MVSRHTHHRERERAREGIKRHTATYPCVDARALTNFLLQSQVDGIEELDEGEYLKTVLTSNMAMRGRTLLRGVLGPVFFVVGLA